jgi:hypothetical protein
VLRTIDDSFPYTTVKHKLFRASAIEFALKIIGKEKTGLKILKRLFLPCALLLAGYLFGAYSFAHAIWPTNVLNSKHNENVAKVLSKNFDEVGAYSNLAGKAEVVCPAQDASSAVILVLGQSNSANHSERKYTTQFPKKVINYYQGKCYTAESPLLGASGLEGEYLTLMGDELIKNGFFQNILIVNTSIGGSKVRDWVDSGRLANKLKLTLDDLKTRYKVTNIIWHQGESDFTSSTSFDVYRASFKSLENFFQQNSISAPILMVTSTICGYNSKWTAQNPVSMAQKSLIDDRQVFLGLDADISLGPKDRRPQSPSQEPNCHLSERGQQIVSIAIAKKITDLALKAQT